MALDVPDETWECISYVMGCSSVLIWLCAQSPQIKKNWRRKSVEGLSSGFLVAWVAGDASNLSGCFLTNQLGVQVLLASYYCIVDVILIIQFSIYRETTEYLDGIDASVAVLGDVSDNTNRSRIRSKSRLEQVKDKVASLITMSMIKPVSSMPVPASSAASDSTTTSSNAAFDLSRSTVALMSSVSATATDGTFASDIGFLVAYFSAGMYLFSRVPQIYHNFQRKSTTGVSMMLFMSAFLGNLTYTLSILSAPQSMGKHANQKEFLMREISYIIGAAGTMLFDCVILAQWLWYQRITAHHRRRPTEPLDRIQRPYLGTPPQPVPGTSFAPQRPTSQISTSAPIEWSAFHVRKNSRQSSHPGEISPSLLASSSPPRSYHSTRSLDESPFL